MASSTMSGFLTLMNLFLSYNIVPGHIHNNSFFNLRMVPISQNVLMLQAVTNTLAYQGPFVRKEKNICFEKDSVYKFRLINSCKTIQLTHSPTSYSRYDHLNTSIMSRGKLLHSGMTSLNSFQVSLLFIFFFFVSQNVCPLGDSMAQSREY